MFKYIITGIIATLLTSCVAFAPFSPIVTAGGPETTPAGTSETVIAVGSAGASFNNVWTTGNGWFGRFKYGMNEKSDIGIDFMGGNYGDKMTYTTKLAARYQLAPHFRLEGGIGAGADYEGRSLNGDLALTCGTLRKNKLWNYYATLRGGYGKGFNADFRTYDTLSPRNAYLALIAVGAQAKINDNMKFIIEGGFGGIFPESMAVGNGGYFTCGLLFNIGKPKE